MPNNTFDFYTIVFGLRNTKNISKSISEAYRVLKKGGRFLCLEFSKVENSNLNFFYKNYSKLIPIFGQVIVGDKKPYEYLVNSIDKFINQEQLIEIMRKNNFTNFSKLRKDQDPIREITKSKWSRMNNSFIYTIEGNSFLHNMVRSIVGCQLAALDGKIYKKQLIDALKTPVESRFNYVAPAKGLYLWKIKY